MEVRSWGISKNVSYGNPSIGMFESDCRDSIEKINRMKGRKKLAHIFLFPEN
jgi:hypothetical protein